MDTKIVKSLTRSCIIICGWHNEVFSCIHQTKRAQNRHQRINFSGKLQFETPPLNSYQIAYVSKAVTPLTRIQQVPRSNLDCRTLSSFQETAFHTSLKDFHIYEIGACPRINLQFVIYLCLCATMTRQSQTRANKSLAFTLWSGMFTASAVTWTAECRLTPQFCVD